MTDIASDPHSTSSVIVGGRAEVLTKNFLAPCETFFSVALTFQHAPTLPGSIAAANTIGNLTFRIVFQGSTTTTTSSSGASLARIQAQSDDEDDDDDEDVRVRSLAYGSGGSLLGPQQQACFEDTVCVTRAQFTQSRQWTLPFGVSAILVSVTSTEPDNDNGLSARVTLESVVQGKRDPKCIIPWPPLCPKPPRSSCQAACFGCFNPFPVTLPCPTVTSVTPSSLSLLASAFTLTGTNFQYLNGLCDGCAALAALRLTGTITQLDTVTQTQTVRRNVILTIVSNTLITVTILLPSSTGPTAPLVVGAATLNLTPANPGCTTPLTVPLTFVM